MSIKYTLTNDNVTVVVDGKIDTFQAGTVNFNAIRKAIVENKLDTIPGLLAPKDALAGFLKHTDFTVEGDTIKFGSEVVPDALAAKIRELANKDENPIGYLNFFARLQKNPSSRSVEQLTGSLFLTHRGHPIEASGHFLAYKGVNDNLTDCHSGTIDNTPGTVHTMQRNKVSDDPNHTCHFGFHVGSLKYASDFGSRLIICRIDPENVVCVPNDYSGQKMRVCEYEVVGFHVSDGDEKPLPDTTFEDDTVDYSADNEDVDDDSDHDEELLENDYPVDKVQVAEEREAKVKKAKSLHHLAPKDLIRVSLADLRTYASKTLKIVGASKLPGGKTALLKRIAKVRSKGRK